LDLADFRRTRFEHATDNYPTSLEMKELSKLGE